MDNKENKKFNFRNVTTTHGRSNFLTPQGSSRFGELESVFNSTAYLPNEIISADTDISTIPSISTTTSHFDFNNELVMTAANYKSNTPGEVVASSDLLTKQTEIDALYLQYLMITTMNVTLKKKFKDEEECVLKDAMDLFKTNEILKKTCFDLEYEEEIVDNFLELVEIMDLINKWIDENYEELKSFQGNYQKLAEICSKAKNYLMVANIHKPDNLDFEETVAAELKKTTHIIQQINNIFDENDLKPPPSSGMNEKIDFKLIEGLRVQNSKLKDCIIRYNGLKIIQK